MMYTNEQMLENMTDREHRRYRWTMRRRRELQKKCILFCLSLCLIGIFVVLYHSITISANTGEEQIFFKYYTSIHVEYGENLWNIADRYIDYGQYEDKNVYIEEVKHMNHLGEDGAVKAGQYLIVPYYSTEFR